MAMMVLPVGVWNAVVVVALSAIAYHFFTKVIWAALWQPLRMRRIMAKQGVQGLPFRFLIGQLLQQGKYMNSFPEVVPIDSYAAFSPTVTPQYALFFPQFPGQKYFLYFWGTDPRLVVRDPDMAKELFVNNHASLKKSPFEEWLVHETYGSGLITSVGKKWAMQRRAMNPYFHHDSLKGIVEPMVQATVKEISNWEQIVAQAGGSAEIDVESDIRKITGRVLSLTAFGTDYETGERIHELGSELGMAHFQMVLDPKFWLIPYFRRIPTKQHRHMDHMFWKMDALLRELIESRLTAVRDGKTSSHGDDLLGRLLKVARAEWEEEPSEFNLTSVLNNCKLMFVAGQDSSGVTLAYSMLMLALHPEWQRRAREEVLEVLGDEEDFSASVLSRLKVVGMILNETLRTFPPVPTLVREATKDLQLQKGLRIPKGLTIEFAPGALHQDTDYWGDDVADYNPGRFANGVSGACSHPHAFNPFGLGPKICIGSNYAQMEMKIIMAKLLRRFEFLPSPNYKHHPVCILMTKPKYGMPLILKARQQEPRVEPVH